MIKLAANQLLIVCNFEHFSSSTLRLGNIFILSHSDKNFSTVVEADLHDKRFHLVNDALNLSDLLRLVKSMPNFAFVLWVSSLD